MKKYTYEQGNKVRVDLVAGCFDYKHVEIKFTSYNVWYNYTVSSVSKPKQLRAMQYILENDILPAFQISVELPLYTATHCKCQNVVAQKLKRSDYF